MAQSVVVKKDFNKINKFLQKKESYTEDKAKFEKLKIKALSDSGLLAMSITDESNSYNGCVNEKLERSGFGSNKYANGDYYIGEWTNNLKHQDGIYIFNPSILGSRRILEAYSGNWNGNTKHGLGTYIWINDDIDNNTIDSPKLFMDCFIGLFDNDTFHMGLYLSKIGDEYYTYYGKFDSEKRKHDSKAMLYDNKNDKVMRAVFEKNKLVSGYLSEFDTDKNETLKKFNYIRYDNGVPKAVITENFIEKDTITKVSNECRRYRDRVIESNCFHYAYDAAVLIIELIPKLESIEFINSEEGYKEFCAVISKSNGFEIFPQIHRILS